MRARALEAKFHGRKRSADEREVGNGTAILNFSIYKAGRSFFKRAETIASRLGRTGFPTDRARAYCATGWRSAKVAASNEAASAEKPQLRDEIIRLGGRAGRHKGLD